MPDLIRHPVPRPDESREPSQTLGPGFQIEVRDKLHAGTLDSGFRRNDGSDGLGIDEVESSKYPYL